jgi:hypothetical protein
MEYFCLFLFYFSQYTVFIVDSVDITEIWEEEPAEDGENVEDDEDDKESDLVPGVETGRGEDSQEDPCRQFNVCVLYVMEVGRKTDERSTPSQRGVVL